MKFCLGGEIGEKVSDLGEGWKGGELGMHVCVT